MTATARQARQKIYQRPLVYFEEIQVLLAFQAHLRDILPAHLKAQGLQIVESYYATRTTNKKTIVRAQFKVGKICRILCVTEAFGMVLDISNIARVYNWGLPRSVSSLIQRFGFLWASYGSSSSSLAAGDLGRETEKRLLRWRAWLLEYAVVETL
jgi:Helicase conserved C-terminal domain